MEAAITQPAPLSDGCLTEVALRRIITMARTLASDSTMDRWVVYEAAKGAIRSFDPTEDQYQNAIRELAAALDI